jgi:hypothetical protein
MSFAVWKEKPPFEFGPEDPEHIFPVGAMFVVTDDPARATQAEVDAALNPPPPRVRTVDEKLATLGLTVADLKAELAK